MIRAIGSIMLTFSLLLCFSSSIFAESSTASSSKQSIGVNAISKTVEVIKTYPSWGYFETYEYDDGVFSGTLYFVSATLVNGGGVTVVYRGTVYA